MRAAVVAIVLAAGCTVASVDYAGKRCPCIDGYVCEVTTSSCVTPDSIDPPVDAGVPDAPLPPLPPPNGRVVVSDLKVAWTTPQQVRWTWTTTGDPADFGEYQIRTGSTRAQLETPTTVIGGRLWTRADNPELGEFAPRSTSQGSPQTIWSVTVDHVGDRDVFGQVFAIDRAGNATSTAIVVAHTRPGATQSQALYLDALPASAVARPAAFKPSGQDTFNNSQQCYALDVACAPGETSCQKDVDFESLPDTLPQGFGPNELAGAFFEFAMGGNAFVPGRYTTVELQIGNGTTCSAGALGACRYRYAGIAVPAAGVYRKVQIPLTAFVRSGGDALSAQALAAEKLATSGTYWGGEWKTGSSFRVDAVRIRW